jgi:hypothetical protein
MHRRLLALVLLGGALAPLRAAALPDLTPEIYGVKIDTNQTPGPGDVAEGCAAATGGLTLLRFGLRTHNIGDEAEVIGDPGCPSCTLYPGAACANPNFVCSPANGHMHPHFASFGKYELLDMRGNIVKLGAKRGFCLRDDLSCGSSPFTCNYQGISPGCFDDYKPELGCQYIDVTGVPGIGTRAFRLRATVDPLQLLADADRSNNVTEVVLPGCGDGVLQDGEECDPGVPGSGVCCDADCHVIPGCDSSCALRPAGSVCRPATGPCDVAEVCDGASPSCPADTGLADGAACGATSDDCIRNVCRVGACTAEQQLSGCLVGAGCYPAGAADPKDACQFCDPSRSIDLWSPDQDPTPKGVGCQLIRVERASQGIACPGGIAARMSAKLGRARHMADELLGVSPGAASRLESRLLRLSRRLSRLLQHGERRGCSSSAALAEMDALVSQLRGMRAQTR